MYSDEWTWWWYVPGQGWIPGETKCNPNPIPTGFSGMPSGAELGVKYSERQEREDSEVQCSAELRIGDPHNEPDKSLWEANRRFLFHIHRGSE